MYYNIVTQESVQEIQTTQRVVCVSVFLRLVHWSHCFIRRFCGNLYTKHNDQHQDAVQGPVDHNDYIVYKDSVDQESQVAQTGHEEGWWYILEII